MKKDGTRYIAYVVRENPKYNRWEIVYWGSPAMITGAQNCWCSQTGLGLKYTEITHYVLLDDFVTAFQNGAFKG